MINQFEYISYLLTRFFISVMFLLLGIIIIGFIPTLIDDFNVNIFIQDINGNIIQSIYFMLGLGLSFLILGISTMVSFWDNYFWYKRYHR